MIGYARLSLALLVALSHAGWRWGGWNPGVIAVVGFYMISGMAMYALWHQKYQIYATSQISKASLVLAFYVDRLLRLWPAYLLVACLTAIWFWVHGIDSIFLSRPATNLDIWNQLTILPLNWYAWNDSDHFVLVPPAWSLGAELQFYLLVPWIMGMRRGLWFIVSLCIAVLAVTGYINSELWGYRLLPGVLWIFLWGSVLSEVSLAMISRWYLWFKYSVCIGLLFLSIVLAQSWALPYNYEVCSGLILGTILCLGSSRISVRGDSYAGQLAYPVFLGHFLVLWIIGPLENVALWIAFIVGLFLLAAVLVIGIELPMTRYRHYWRKMYFKA